MLSCLLPLAALDGRAVTTVEGLGTPDEPGPLQRAFVEEQAAQCGYCIAGMIMRAQALLARTRTFSEQELREHMQPNLCRCGTHMRILRAVRRAAPACAPPKPRPCARRPRDDDARPFAPPAGCRRWRTHRQHLARCNSNPGASSAGRAQPRRFPAASRARRCSIRGSASMRMELSRCLPERPSSARASRPRCCRSHPKSSALRCRASSSSPPTRPRRPDEGYTSGSQSMPNSATAIRNAAAQVREILLARAAERLSVNVERIKIGDGIMIADDGSSVGFGELVGNEVLHVAAHPTSSFKEPSTYTVVGKQVARVDIPAKVTGGVAYVHDLRLPGMVHARVVRPPTYGARLAEVDARNVETMPGVLKVVRDGSFLAVIAGREYQAVQAMWVLAQAARWIDPKQELPDQAAIYDYLKKLPARDTTILNRGMIASTGSAYSATYHRPYQMHGAIGPACAIALYADDSLTVWSHGQGMFPLRRALAELVGFRPTRFAASTWKVRAATATTAPMTPEVTLPCWRARSRAGRCACNGCANRNTPWSHMVPQ